MEEHEQKVAVLEECRSSVDQEASMLRSSRRELEKSRLQARREMQELRRQVKENVLVEVQKPHMSLYLTSSVAPLGAGEAPGGGKRTLSAGAAGAANPVGSGGAEGGGGTSQGIHCREESPGV